MLKLLTSLTFICMLAIVVLGTIYPRWDDIKDAKPVDVTGRLYNEAFQKLSRDEQIKKCSECHQKELQDESDGPHSKAFDDLNAHKDFVNGPHYTNAVYTKYVNNRYTDNCVSCHSPQNFFENMLSGYRNGDSLTAALLARPYPPFKARENVMSRKTGIDCLSCHFDGKGVLSSNERFKTTSTAICNPRYSSFFKNTAITCYPCHSDQVISLNTVNKQYLQNLTCNNCHVKYDSSRGQTHYYFWSKGAALTENMTYAGLLGDFSFRAGKSGDNSSIIWQNNYWPHILSLCPEMILKFEILNKDSIVLGKSTLRINRKKDYESIMHDYFDNKDLGGIAGANLPQYKGETIYQIKVERPEAAKFFKMTVTSKAQYWFSDTLGTIAYSGIKLIK